MLTYSTRPRGGVVHALYLAEALHRLGTDVHLFALKRRDEDAPPHGFHRETRVPYSLFDYDWSSDTRSRLESMVRSIVKNLPTGFDIYHAQDCVCDTALIRLVADGKVPPPTVRTVHHVEGFPDPYLNECELRALRSGTSAKITVSRYWRDRLLETYGIESVVIHNGIDMGRFRAARREREPMLLFVGGMEARKGLEFAIQSIEVLRRRGRELRLVAVARPGFRGVESRDWFGHLIERCGVGDLVTIKEEVSDDELLDLYSRASALLLPTRMEGWGLSIMEAMAAGCPVIASPVGGVTELVKDGVDGLLVGVGDLFGLADAVELLVDDDHLRDRLVKSGLETARGYSWDEAARRTLEYYDSLLTRGG